MHECVCWQVKFNAKVGWTSQLVVLPAQLVNLRVFLEDFYLI